MTTHMLCRRMAVTLLMTYFFSPICFPQIKLNYEIEAKAGAGSKNAPFWFTNNTNGLGSFSSNSGFLRTLVDKKIDPVKKFSYGFGLELVASYNHQSPFFVQQAYAELKYKNWGMTAGSKKSKSLIQNDELSSGSMVQSQNARPVPQVSIGLPEFTNVPFTRDWIQVRGEIAYGRFTDDRFQRTNSGTGRYAEQILYHRKYLIFKVEKDKPFYATIGIDMAAQFGGETSHPDGKGGYWHEYFPSGLKAFCKVFVPMKGGDDSPGIDQVNITGNHLGSYLMELGYKKSTFKIRAYYEHYFDDHSGMIFKNSIDGLWGLEYSRGGKSFVSGALFEFMNSTDQSGPFLWDTNGNIPIQVSGGDDYYHHASYPGWTHWNMTVGNPFITSPGYNGSGYLGFENTRVRAYHLGINGYVHTDVKYKLLLSYMKGWGTPNAPFIETKEEFSSLLTLDYMPHQLKGWSFSASAGVDSGTLLGNNWGLNMSITKRFH